MSILQESHSSVGTLSGSKPLRRGSCLNPMTRVVSLCFWLIVVFFCWGALVDVAGAQYRDSDTPSSKSYDSPERFALELKIGPYVPEVGSDRFEEIYRDDSGLMLAFQLDVVAFRLKDILYLNAAGGIGYADYTGPARDVDTDKTTGEEANFDMIPLSLLGVLRCDALARLLEIPFIFTGKLGYIWFIWDDEKGNADIADGISHGLLWAAQIALDLDFFDRGAARMLDDEWGINHSFIFFEVYGTNTYEGLPLDETTWSAGLGFVM
ncbi:MAG: hypothetical protein JXA30_00220 [Deltaproteobacteria bacterium]|nr:hypothetical protein [Deltaproteobacteria bacterium]